MALKLLNHLSVLKPHWKFFDAHKKKTCTLNRNFGVIFMKGFNIFI